MTKVKCPFEYCRHIKAGICSKPTITIDDEGCLDLKLVGLTQKDAEKMDYYTLYEKLGFDKVFDMDKE